MIHLLYNEISREYVQVVGNGVKTYKVLLNELFALIDITKVTTNSYICIIDSTTQQKFGVVAILSNRIDFSSTDINASGTEADIISIRLHPPTYTNYDYFAVKATGNTYSSFANTAVASGAILRVCY